MDTSSKAHSDALTHGEALHGFAARLYPICRSITGDGVRKTLALIRERIPLVVHEVRSGSRVFDWQVPDEWNIEDAAVIDPDGRRVVDFRAHNLHIVNYSEPVATSMSLEELAPRLHSLPEHPDWIPYRTSYYRRTWGFCMRARDREALRPGKYRVEIRSSLEPGSLTYGELAIKGRSRDEVLLFAHVCHPSLANDNTSGMSIATALAEWIAREPRRYTYRFVFAPGTIGSLSWLARNEDRLNRVRYGLVLALLGDPGPLTYKRSRRENAPIDEIAAYALEGLGGTVPFSPYGYDERQLCSPGFDLPVGRLTRSVNGGYPQYHSSADDLSLIRPDCLQQSLEACQRIVEVIEGNCHYVNLSPKGEPRLGARGLYGSTGGGRAPAEREHAMLWVLNQSDGSHSLLDIAKKSSLGFNVIHEAAGALERAKLLAAVGPAPKAPRSARAKARGSAANKTRKKRK